MPSDALPDFATTLARVQRRRGRRLPRWLAKRRAAVAVILRPTGDATGTEILLVERALRPGDPWSGDMAFPGGLSALSDASLEATATRETLEEVGLDLASHAQLVTTLSEQLTLSPDRKPLVVRPFVFRIERGASDLDPRVQSHEIASSHWIDLGFFSRPADHATLSRRYLGIPMAFTCYRHEGRAVWGLTLRMVRELLASVRRSMGSR